MSILKALIVILVSISLSVFCQAGLAYEHLKVELSPADEFRSLVQISFINTSESDISLPIYVFCNGDSIYLNVFEIQRGDEKSKNDLGYYGGLTDFVTNKMIDSGKKLIISPKSKKSCIANLSTAYSVYQSGQFNVTYVLHEKLLDITSKTVLTSNTISINFKAAN